ncbi:MAG: type VI secretion system baseplate subunit TssG [Gemmataceae bacterium]
MSRSTIFETLFDPEKACAFEPFQAVRLLELLVNQEADSIRPAEWKEVEFAVRFRTHLTMSFPPSLIAQIIPPNHVPTAQEEQENRRAFRIRNRYRKRDVPGLIGHSWQNVPTLVGNFFGLFGPNGALPLIYTRTLCELDSEPRYRKTSSRTALRDWFDLFNHRMTQLLFHAWQKYRFTVPYSRSTWRLPPGELPKQTDRISQVLFSIVGLGTPPLRNRIGVFPHEKEVAPETPPLARVDDRSILHYLGAFARRRPGAFELGAIIEDYFNIPVRVDTLTGQWLKLPPSVQTRLSDENPAALGVNAVAGEQVWDASSRFLLRLGPLMYRQFVSFLPDPQPVAQRKGAYLLSQVTRLYVGPELDFELQLVLKKEDVPPPELRDAPESELGMRLGWNIWLCGDEGLSDDADDLQFDAPCEPVLPRV